MMPNGSQSISNGTKRSRLTCRRQRGFTLLEVMIAVAIFFMAVFAILDLTSQNLRAARSLRIPTLDVSSLAAELSLTNKIFEGVESGDFGPDFPDYRWERAITMVSTGGLFQVDFSMYWAVDRKPAKTDLSILLFRPDSVTPVGGGRR